MKKNKIYAYACASLVCLTAMGGAISFRITEEEETNIQTTAKSEVAEVNMAARATVSAHYTASWNNLHAVNDGVCGTGTDLPNNQTWASWSNNRPANGWLVYEWNEKMKFCRSVIYYWTDTADSNAGNGVAMPSSYTIQYWDEATAEWKDVTLSGMTEYPSERLASNEVKFEAVETSKLRLHMNASTNGSTYAAFGVTEWETYAEVQNPMLITDKSQVVVAKGKGQRTQQLTLSGLNVNDEGVNVTINGELPGVSIAPGCEHFSKEETEAGATVTVTFNPETAGAKTALGQLTLTSGNVTKTLPLMSSMDEDFIEHAGNLIYDPCFYTMERFSVWNTAPEVVTLADYDGVKCGATCLRFKGSKTGIEIKRDLNSTIVQKGLYLTAGSYVISGEICTNGTFDIGVYAPEKNILSTDEENVEVINNMQLSFTVPDTKGEWIPFEYTFRISKDALCGAWANNDRGKTATLAYLDNFQIYNTEYTFENTEITTYKDYDITPVNFTQVHFTDQFWKPRMVQNQEVTIPEALGQCYKNGRVDNFKKAAGLMEGYFVGDNTFDDTDIYKILEGMSYSIQVTPNQTLSDEMDYLIGLLAQAQEEDGYLYTPRTAGDPAHPHSWMGPLRWEWDPNLSHELYNCGHLFEAAYAHYNATGKSTLLNVAIKNADLLVKDFLEGGLTYEPGHQIVEMGLVKMYRVTGNKDYLALAKYFLDLRGTKGVMRSEYSQSHKPVVMQDEAVGHAVRAAYMYSGMADVAAMTENKDYLLAIDKIWENVVSKKYYITGGIGAKRDGEAFDKDYVLPNKEAYCETCAAIGNVYWNHRLFLLHGNAKYYDVLERTLYNSVLSGIGLDGKTFFYPNPLEADGSYKFNQGSAQRAEWFGCACCPSNLCRFMASVPGYVYACKDNSLYVNLFVQSEAEIDVAGQKVKLTQKTEYPWDGTVSLTVTPETNCSFGLKIRIPGWAQNRPVPSDLYTYENPSNQQTVVRINGTETDYTIQEDGYVLFDREWQNGDKIELEFPMDVHRVIAHENVAADKGKVALERGPIVYCLESPDNAIDLTKVAVESGAEVSVKDYNVNDYTVKALNIQGKIGGINEVDDAPLVAIPYYTWANRGISRMCVWMKQEAEAIDAKPYTFDCTQWVGVSGRGSVTADKETNTIKGTGAGDFNIAVNFSPLYDNIYALNAGQKYLLVRGRDLSTDKEKSALWWLNGWNFGKTDYPAWTFQNNEGDCFAIWDVTQTGFSGSWPTSGSFHLKSNGTWGTCLGMTSETANGTAKLNDISFYSLKQMLETYPELKDVVGVVELDENNTIYNTVEGTNKVYLHRTLKSNYWNTFCVPFDMTAAQIRECGIVRAKILTDIYTSDNHTVLKFSDAKTLEAGKPYIVKTEQEQDILVLDQAEFKANIPGTVECGELTMYGNYASTFVPQDDYFIRNNMFYIADKSEYVALKGFRAAISLHTANLVNSLLIDIDGQVVEIEKILGTSPTSFVDVYALNGMRLKTNIPQATALQGLPKGVYIVNGQKMVKSGKD